MMRLQLFVDFQLQPDFKRFENHCPILKYADRVPQLESNCAYTKDVSRQSTVSHSCVANLTVSTVLLVNHSSNIMTG